MNTSTFKGANTMIYKIGDRLFFKGDIFPVEIIDITETHVVTKALKNVQPKQIKKEVFEQYIAMGYFEKA